MMPFTTARPAEREVACSAAELPTQLHPPSFHGYVWLWDGPFLTADRRIAHTWVGAIWRPANGLPRFHAAILRNQFRD